MEFNLMIEMDNYAMDATEVARILVNIAASVSNGYTDGKARDINGNTVGKWAIE